MRNMKWPKVILAFSMAVAMPTNSGAFFHFEFAPELGSSGHRGHSCRVAVTGQAESGPPASLLFAKASLAKC